MMKHHYKNLRIQWEKQFYLCLDKTNVFKASPNNRSSVSLLPCQNKWAGGIEGGKRQEEQEGDQPSRTSSHCMQSCTILPPTLFFPLFVFHHLARLIITLALPRRLEGGGSPCIAFTTLRTLDKTSLYKLPHASVLIIVEMLNSQH